MRITGQQGLRFIGKVANNGAVALTTGEEANFGIVLIPKSVLPNLMVYGDTDFTGVTFQSVS